MQAQMTPRDAWIVARLDEYIPDVDIPLEHRDPFTLLVAVVLSAQCTDKRVNLVTPGLFAEAGHPQAMVELGAERIHELIKTCGLAGQKSRAIHKLSQLIIERFDGKVPDNFKDLESLPGVGHKTASVVMCQAFGRPAFPVDTHIHRLAKRWGLSSGKSVVQTERDLKRRFPESLWGRLHLQMIYYGRAYCPARGHVIEDCPICAELCGKPSHRG